MEKIVFVCLGSFEIGNIWLNYTVYVEEEFENHNDYFLGIHDYIGDIALDALKQSEIIKEHLSIDPRFYEPLNIDIDDSYKDARIKDEWLKPSKNQSEHKFLGAKILNVEHEWKVHKCLVQLTRTLFPDEKHVK